jgi:hypothetical protein
LTGAARSGLLGAQRISPVPTPPRLALALALMLGAAPAAAQAVRPCDPPPPLTALVEPWEDTSAVLAEGAVRLAAILDEAASVELVVLTLPPPGAEAGPSDRTCRIVAEGGIGFAALDLGAMQAAEDAATATYTLRVPGLRFVPESSELEEVTLVLTFGVGDDSLAAAVVE